MEVYYERQMRHNYLIIKQENSCEESYESQMLMANTIDGLLKFRFRQTENGVLYYYEITSKQPLTRLLDGHVLCEGWNFQNTGKNRMLSASGEPDSIGTRIHICNSGRF